MESYEEIRKRAIERKRALLEEHGFSTERLHAAKRQLIVASKSQKKGGKQRSLPVELDALAPRRSSRLAGKERISMRELPDPTPSRSVRGLAASLVEADLDNEAMWTIVPTKGRTGAQSPTIKSTVPSQKSISSKQLNAQVEVLKSRYLGKKIDPKEFSLGNQNKAAAMRAASPSVTPKFSRMSGIQQWANAVFLFVNVGGSDYKNVFLDGGERMTWFAQRTQSVESPVIQRLLDENPPSICLFCRFPDRSYVYCGELKLEKYNQNTRPLQFVWCLQDFQDLLGSSLFQAIVSGKE